MNEIPLGLFESLGAALLILIIYTLIRRTLLTSLLSVTLSYVMSQSILNGNVVVQYATVTSGVINTPVRSLPIHYLLLGISAIMTVMTFYILVMIINARIEGIDESTEIQRMD